MQADSNRPLRKSYTSAQPSRDDPFTLARAAVADALILNPTIGPAAMADVLLNESPEFQQELMDMLARNFYISAWHAAKRLQAAAARAPRLLPGFEHLPLKVPGAKTKEGKQLLLLDANYTRVRAYYRSLTTGHDARKKNDPRVIEAKALLEKMRKRSRKDKGITVREVVLIDR